MAIFDPLQNRNPWADCRKIAHSWLTLRVDALHQIWYKSIHWGLLGKWVKYNVFCAFLFIPFFWDLRTGRWIFTRDSSKDVKSRKDVPFGGLNDVRLNFGGKSPKTDILGAWIGLSSMNDKKIQILITWKLLSRSWRNFYREYAPRMRLRGWSHGSLNKSKMAAAAILDFGKMSITPDWIKISAPNFMERCITAMRRWPRDQKSKPGVN